jgi:uncharacterized membrane protein
MKFLKLSFLFILLNVVFVSDAHDTAKHSKKAATEVITAMDSVHHAHDSTIVNMQTMEPLQYFPTLHPLVVHIPIIFLMMAAVMTVVSLFLFKRELTWTSYVILIIGFVGAYASSTWFHAHTTALPPVTQQLLIQHENFADYTLWSSGIALLLQSVNLFFLKRKFIINIFVALLLITSAVFVAITGHHGAELVHKHGVGAKGHMLEQDHH